MWDVAISEFGDLIISGHGDLLGRSGQDLLEQRMKTRLMIQRGGWIYDADKSLGSNLFRVINMPPSSASQAAIAFVREALRGMDEIIVENVDVLTEGSSITLVIHYRVQDRQGSVLTAVEQTLAISLPVPASGEGESE